MPPPVPVQNQCVDGALQIREFRPGEDNLSELTGLLHRAYARLADLGLRFVATYQDDSITRDRMQGAECYVALRNGHLVGTILFRNASSTDGCPWYARQEVASFGQYAVEPDLQGTGIGSALLAVVEERARETGAAEIALDTAEPAHHLIEMYQSKGYRFIEYVQWDITNYRSVILSKSLR